MSNGRAYYNEIDPYCAQWLRNLIASGHIADGDVDERSIEDVRPCELRGYSQWHLFAGIGVWSYALRLAGWPDSRSVLTCSCPCQPFSAAGKGAGFADERHLWPAAFHVIRELEPATIFGEQVASKDAEPWIDLVHADMETLGCAFGCIPFPAASVGAPNIRDRAYWMAHAISDGCDQARQRITAPRDDGAVGNGAACGLADTKSIGRDEGNNGYTSERFGCASVIVGEHRGDNGESAAGPTNGLWRNADWLLCRDGKWRPVEPSTFPLVDGVAFRVGSGSAYEGKSRAGMLKGYGNAINAQAAAAFIRAYLDFGINESEIAA